MRAGSSVCFFSTKLPTPNKAELCPHASNRENGVGGR